MAFVQNVNATFLRQPNNGLVQITTGTGSSGVVTIYTGSSNGSKVSGSFATGFGSSAAFDLQFGIVNNSVFYGLGTVSIPAGAGSSNSLATVNLLNNTALPGITIDSDGNPELILKSSLDAFSAKMPATSSTWTTGAAVNIIAFTADF